MRSPRSILLAWVGNRSTWLACFILPDCLASYVIIISLTRSLLGIFRKMHFETIQAIAWSLFGYKELKITTKLFIGCCLLIQTQNMSFQSLGMQRTHIFELVQDFKEIFGSILHGFCLFLWPP